MTTEAASAEGGALTVDQAVELFQKPVEQPAAPPEAAVEAVGEPEAPSEAEPEAEAPSEPEEANAEGEDEAEQPEPETPVVEAPSFWDADAKAAFATLTPEQQTIVSAQATKQASEASKAIQTAAEARKTAEGQASRVSELAAGLNDFLPKAVETFQGKWEGIDWARWAQENPTAAFQGKLQFEAEQQELQRLTGAKEQADRLAAEQFVAAEFAKLPEVAPDLADPKEGKARRQKLAMYLIDQGVATVDTLQHVSAKEMSIAYKAMLYDQRPTAPPTLKTPTPKPATPPPAKPSATPARDSQTRSIEQLNARLNQSGDIDDAVRLLQARRK